MANPNPQTSVNSESKGGCLSIIVRLSWIFGGIAVLIYCAVFIAMGKNPGLADLIYWLIAVTIVLVRFVDIKFLKGETLDSKPATLKDWRRYSVRLLLAAGLLYFIAKILAHLDLI